MTTEELIKLAINAPEPCPICNAKPGEPCGSLLSANVREVPHARRLELAKKGPQ